MLTHVRAAVAYAAGLAISGKHSSSVYDYGQTAHRSMSGSVRDGNVDIHDYEAGCAISGKLPNFFHYGEHSHILLTIKGQKFDGYDYGSASHFNGSVRGSSVEVYDYGEAQYFSYSI